MYGDNYQALADAVIMKAVKDFRPAYQRLKMQPDDQKAQVTVREITEFFCSQYFVSLTALDGPALLNRLMRKIDEKK